MNVKTECLLELCDDDLLTAKALFQSKRYLHMGFFCHLIVETIIFLLFLTSVEFATDCKLTACVNCFSNFRYENRSVSGRKPARKPSNRYKKSVRIVAILQNRIKGNFYDLCS